MSSSNMTMTFCSESMKRGHCGDIVVYVVAFYPRKILIINPPMGWGNKSNRGIVMCGENPPIVI
jgi:hypothetical protein